MRVIRKLSSFVNELKGLYFLSADEQRLLELLQSAHRLPAGEGKALVQMVEDPHFLAKFAFFLNAWVKREGQGLSLDWIWLLVPFRGNRRAKTYYLEEWIRRPLAKLKWKKLYLALGGRIAISNAHPSRVPTGEVKALFESIGGLEDLLKLEYKNILVGDLIYDSYLRFTHSATVNLGDPFLKELVEWAMRLTLAYQDLFATNQYRFLLTSYACYIHHGIPARAALQAGVPVYSMGAPNQLTVQLSHEFPFHKRNFHRYKGWFEHLSASEKEEGTKIGHAGLRQRLGGQKDSATYYMKNSAYSAGGPDLAELLPEKTKNTVLIFGHDFFDSPHIYGNMAFPDFYVWLDETLRVLTETDFEVLVKAHPNGLEGNAPIFAAFAARYPSVRFLPASVSSLRLAERGVDLAVTVYGTVAHEMTYLGIPVLCCGENPHSSFRFCTTVNRADEYVKLLKNPSLLPKPVPESDEIAAFYYVHSYRSLKGEMMPFPYFVSSREVTAWLEPGTPGFEERLKLCGESLARLDSI